VGVSTLVFGVTGFARVQFALSVESGLGTHISPNVLVAIHAQAILRILVKFDVTLLAFFFPLGVTLNQLARSHDGFESLCPNTDIE
jgi:hypothetical protein